MIFCIDGTGTLDPQAYLNDMKRGFCYHIKEQYSNSKYLRGPDQFGTLTWKIGDAMLAEILNVKLVYEPSHNIFKNMSLNSIRQAIRNKNFTNSEVLAVRQAIFNKQIKITDVPITLVGHSRGAAACIYIAYQLQKMNIKVDAMLLFDAVDRAFGFDTTNIPENVGKCLHLMRNPEFANYFRNTSEYKDLVARAVPEYLENTVGLTGPGATTQQGFTVQKKNPEWLRLQELEKLHVIMQDMCRVNCTKFGIQTGFSFGNTGTKWNHDKTDYHYANFMATHGAMGGAPLQTSKQFNDQRDWGLIAEAEVMAMFSIETRAKNFLAEVNETGNLKLDYLPMCTVWDQTAF